MACISSGSFRFSIGTSLPGTVQVHFGQLGFVWGVPRRVTPPSKVLNLKVIAHSPKPIALLLKRGFEVCLYIRIVGSNQLLGDQAGATGADHLVANANDGQHPTRRAADHCFI